MNPVPDLMVNLVGPSTSAGRSPLRPARAGAPRPSTTAEAHASGLVLQLWIVNLLVGGGRQLRPPLIIGV